MFASCAWGVAVVRVCDQSEVDGDEILLSDIADIEATDGPEAEALASVTLMKAASPGESRVFDGDYVRLRLSQERFDESNVKLHAPERVEVKTACTVVRGADIAAATVDYVLAEMPFQRQGVSVDPVRRPPDVVLPVGQPSIEISTRPGTTFLGRTLLHALVTTGRGVSRIVTVTVNVSVEREVLVAYSYISRHEPLSEEMFRWETRDLGDIGPDAVMDLAEIVDMQASRTVSPGSVLTRRMIGVVPVVRRGDLVTMVLETPSLRITAKGEVKKDAGLGQAVTVSNSGSGRLVTGLVTGPGEVTVSPSGGF